MATLQTLLHVVGIGIGATIVMDLWLAMLQRVGEPADLGRTLMMGAGWVVNLGVTEWLMRARTVVNPVPSTT